jgi:Flp pilus assembly protein TadG
VLMAMCALVLDVGSWYRADRATQSTADAAATAGAQALPYNVSNASPLAVQYADKNGGGLSPSDVTISNGLGPNDTIKVTVHKPANGIFTRLFGISSITVGSTATARASLMKSVTNLAPIGVNLKHPMLTGKSGCPCFGVGNSTTLPLGKTGAPGSFDLLDIDQSTGGIVGASTLADWILNGFDGYLDLGSYLSDPGAKWNDSPITNALTQRLNTVLLFPVYDVLSGSGANATYHVVAWVGFHLTSFTASGTGGSITGYFTQVIWDGIESTSSDGSSPDLGARTVTLIN